jgi:hypothetical protein
MRLQPSRRRFVRLCQLPHPPQVLRPWLLLLLVCRARVVLQTQQALVCWQQSATWPLQQSWAV